MTSKEWVLVTGGAHRLGREFCLAFARSGWNIFCHYKNSADNARETQEMVQRLGMQCILIQQDLNDPNAHNLLLDSCESHTAKLPRCIVNNASLFAIDSAQSANAELLQTHFQTNTVVPLLLGNAIAQRAALTKPPAESFCVIHVLDQKVHNLNPDYFSYTVSKLALHRSVALQAQSLAPWVRVCGLSPGLSYLSGDQTQENFDKASLVNLLKKAINPKDIADAAVFIATNESMTGSTVQIDNGQHLIPLERDVMFVVNKQVNA